MRRQVFDQVEQVEWVDGECARGDRGSRKRQTENMSTVKKEGAAGGNDVKTTFRNVEKVTVVGAVEQVEQVDKVENSSFVLSAT
eukprot:8582585-Alexandrium_andersonii.AAC.1